MHIFNMSITRIHGLKKIQLKTVGGVDYTNSIPYNAKHLPKMTKSKWP